MMTKTKIHLSRPDITGKEINDKTMQAQSVKGYMEGGVSVDEIVVWIKKEKAVLTEILEVSMQVETNSLDLYMKMLIEVEDKSARNVLNVIIEEEKAHLLKLGTLFGSKINR